jgi:hypothetical protein
MGRPGNRLALPLSKAMNKKAKNTKVPEGGESKADKTVSPPQEYDPCRLITPVMAVCGMAGDGAAISLPSAGEDPSTDS